MPAGKIGNLTLSNGRFKLLEQASEYTLIVGNFVLFHNPFETLLSSVECSSFVGSFLFFLRSIFAAKAFKPRDTFTLSAFAVHPLHQCIQESAFLNG